MLFIGLEANDLTLSKGKSGVLKHCISRGVHKVSERHLLTVSQMTALSLVSAFVLDYSKDWAYDFEVVYLNSTCHWLLKCIVTDHNRELHNRAKGFAFCIHGARKGMFCSGQCFSVKMRSITKRKSNFC